MLLALDRSILPPSYSVFSDDGTPLVVNGNFTPAAMPVPTRIAVAVGPGSFSGIRSALAFAQGLALPVGAQVIGIPTPAAIWRAFAHEHPGTKSGIVVGDARRGKLWIWRSAETPETPPRLIGAGDIAQIAETTVVTPDFNRLGARFPAAFPAPPISRAVGELALEGVSLTPLPVYLTEAV